MIEDEILEAYVNMMKDAPEACKECERRHFIGCFGCKHDSYWTSLEDSKKNTKG